MLVQQRADHPRRIHPADLGNLRRSHRLLIRNHRQCLERWHRETQRRPQALDESPHHVMLLRLGKQFVPARHLADLDPALLARVARHQLIQRSLHRQFLFPQRPRQLLDRRRLIRRINNRFQCRSSLFVSHNLLLVVAGLSRCLRSGSDRKDRCISLSCVGAGLQPGQPHWSANPLRPQRLCAIFFFILTFNFQLSTVNYLYSSSICLIPPLSSNAKSNILCFRTRISPNCFSCASATACSFTISSTARNATIIACREGHASKNCTKFTALSALARICARICAIICATVNSSCRSSIRDTSFRRSSTCWNTLTKSTSETTKSPSVPSSL